jgi:hypothetical protein
VHLQVIKPKKLKSRLNIKFKSGKFHLKSWFIHWLYLWILVSPAE